MSSSVKKSEAKPRCFVISPIGDPGSPVRMHADMVLESIIKPALADFDVKRGDELGAAEMISDKMIEAIFDYELAIADLTGNNSNVFYEVGLRHMIEKPVIHIAADGTKLPFDTAGVGTLHYNILDIHSHKRARDEIIHAIGKVMASGYKVSNPVTAARGAIKLRESSDTAEIMLAQMREQIADIERRLSKSPPQLPMGLFTDTGGLDAPWNEMQESQKRRNEKMARNMEALDVLAKGLQKS